MVKVRRNFTETERLFIWYLAHQKELVALFNKKYLVIHNYEVCGAFDKPLAAVANADSRFLRETYIVQKCAASRSSTLIHTPEMRVRRGLTAEDIAEYGSKMPDVEA